MTDYDELFGTRVKAMRKSQRRSQETLSGLILSGSGVNINQVTLSRIENGQQSPYLSQACVIAAALSVSLDDLLAGTQPTETDLRVANADLMAENARLVAGLWRTAQVATDTIGGGAS